MVVNFCLNTWQRNVEIVTFLKWCLSVFTNNTCVLLGGLKEIFWGKTLLSHCWPIHCWLWRAFLQREFSWHQVQIRFSWSHPCLPWAGPLVSLTGAAPSDHTFTRHCVSYFLLCTVFRVLPANTIFFVCIWNTCTRNTPKNIAVT